MGILDTLYFNGNDGLCAPGDAAFQDWLRTIPQVRGDTCVSGSEETDRASLTAFYNATDGDNWFNNTNWLTDSLLNEWHGVSTNNEGHVVSLDLRSNSLSGAVPPEIGGLINLSHLHLGSNQLTGTLPPELGNLTRLEFLDLSYNRLWGELPRGMTALSVLHRFGFDYNSGLCATPEPGFQEWLQSIPLLRSGPTCVLTASPPDDRGIAALITLYNATDGANWDDKTNWLSEQPLQYWAGVTINSEGRVTELDLFANQLSGDIPVELGNLISLQGLSLGGNQLSGDIPATLGRPTYLEVLDLSDNQLTGAIPPELANLTELNSLSLAANQLTGEIPDWLGSLDQLAILTLYDNQLTGAIPPELANLTELNSLSLAANQLTGEIPDWLGSLDQLVFLSVNDNQLTGAIPPELGSLHQTGYTVAPQQPANRHDSDGTQQPPTWSGRVIPRRQPINRLHSQSLARCRG